MQAGRQAKKETHLSTRLIASVYIDDILTITIRGEKNLVAHMKKYNVGTVILSQLKKGTTYIPRDFSKIHISVTREHHRGVSTYDINGIKIVGRDNAIRYCFTKYGITSTEFEQIRNGKYKPPKILHKIKIEIIKKCND